MSLPPGHFAVGVVGTAFLLHLVERRRRVERRGTILALGGLWAMLPDLGTILPGVGELDHTPYVDLFWFHYYLDVHDVADSWAVSLLLVALMAGALGAFALGRDA